MKLVVYINEDPDMRRQFQKLAEGDGIFLKAVGSASDANSEPAAVFCIDISSVAGSLYDFSMAYSAIIHLIEDHPEVPIVIVSAVGRKCAEEVLDDVEGYTGVRPFYGGQGDWEGLLPILRSVL